MSKNEVYTNLDAIGEMIGALAGIKDGLDEDSYTESLIKRAHGKASSAFDIAAAATGSAGHLAHVYEYGTAGITPGPVMFPDPTAKEARLYEHTLVGRGGQQDIGYTFRPAVNRNPQPTTKSTGVPSKYLKRLSRRKYVFWNRAFVMETGKSVEIKAKNSDYLFVPFNNKPSMNPKNHRGYMMWNSTMMGPLEVTPGQSVQGNFTSFWLGWWGGQGNQIIEKSMADDVTSDTEKAVEAAVARANRHAVKPVTENKITQTAKKAEALVQKIFRSRRVRNGQRRS